MPKRKDKSMNKSHQPNEEDAISQSDDNAIVLNDELKTLLDNFGHYSLSEPILTNRTVDTESSVLELSVRKVVFKDKHPGAEQKTEDLDLNNNLPADNLIRSSTDSLCNNCTTTDARSIYLDCKDVRFCPQCVCSNHKHQPKKYKEEIKGLQKECTNRYSLNHLHYSRRSTTPMKSNRWSLLPLLRRWRNRFRSSSTINKNKYDRIDFPNESSSGITIPQLYKANISHTLGYTPGKFTFRAVTGDPFTYQETTSTQEISEDLSRNEQPFISKEKENLTYCACACMENYDKVPLLNECHPKEYKSNREDSTQDKDGTDSILGHQEYVVTRLPPERIDIYCFDHLNTGYFRTSDHPPPLLSDIAIERVEQNATRFWAEIFGFVHLITAFLIAFILQFYKFILYGIVRPLMVGLVQLTSDYFIKPLLTITYNGFTQPTFIFIYNVLTSFRDLCNPLAKGIGYFLAEIAVVLRAIRFIEWKSPESNRKNNTKTI